MSNLFKDLTPEQFQIFFDSYRSLAKAITQAGGNPSFVLSKETIDMIASWTQNNISITAKYVRPQDESL